MSCPVVFLHPPRARAGGGALSCRGRGSVGDVKSAETAEAKAELDKVKEGARVRAISIISLEVAAPIYLVSEGIGPVM